MGVIIVKDKGATLKETLFLLLFFNEDFEE